MADIIDELAFVMQDRKAPAGHGALALRARSELLALREKVEQFRTDVLLRDLDKIKSCKDLDLVEALARKCIKCIKDWDK